MRALLSGCAETYDELAQLSQLHSAACVLGPIAVYRTGKHQSAVQCALHALPVIWTAIWPIRIGKVVARTEWIFGSAPAVIERWHARRLAWWNHGEECSPLLRTAVFSFSGAFCENASTLPVPLSGSNDWAKAGVAMTVSNATVLRNFFCRFSSI
jgi:hypothetical protein